jgi:hypothetical protein
MNDEQHAQSIPPDELVIVRTSLTEMVHLLEDGCDQSIDPPGPVQPSVVTVVHNGKPGRPRIEIDREFLDQALALRGPHTIGPLLGCHPRTVRRRALEYQMVEAAEPVRSQVVELDGAVRTIWTSTTPPMSTLTDEQLDRLMGDILQMFPHFGRRMIAGTLLSMGHRVSQTRVRDSYVRVWGAPSVFGTRPIVRKVYWVPGVNSLWHHDGNHGECCHLGHRPLILKMNRLNPMENGRAWFYGWQITPGCWNENQ